MRTSQPFRHLLLALVLATGGCGSTGDKPEGGKPKPIPWTSTPYTVTLVTPRGPFFEVVLTNPQSELRFYFPTGSPCQGLLKSETPVEYVVMGPLGRIRVGEESCDPAGTGSLRWMRDSRPRPQTQEIAPRGQANFSTLYEDSEVALVRGRFPLTGLIGWAGGEDTIAVLPKTPECARPLSTGVASIEYRVAGPYPLFLIGESGRCPLTGLIRPASVQSAT